MRTFIYSFTFLLTTLVRTAGLMLATWVIFNLLAGLAFCFSSLFLMALPVSATWVMYEMIKHKEAIEIIIKRGGK